MKIWFPLPAGMVMAGTILSFALNQAQAEYNPFRTDTYGDAQRAGRMEFYMIGQYWGADDSVIPDVTLDIGIPPNQVTETGDLRMSFDDAFVWGFGMGYNLNSHFTVRGEFTFGNPEYSIDFNNSSGRAEAFTQAGKFNLDYNLIRGPVTPFITAGVGYFMTERAKVPKVQRHNLTPLIPGQAPVRYYIKNVPAEHKASFQKAFDSWNEVPSPY